MRILALDGALGGFSVAFLDGQALVSEASGAPDALETGLERIARGLARAETAYQAAATIGLVVSIEAVVSIWYGQQAIPFPAFLPTHSVKIGDTYVTVDQLITRARVTSRNTE